MVRLPAIAVVLACTVTIARAAPDTPTARLRYTRGAEAASCPDEDELRNLVSARLGYDPFRDDAPSTVVATIAKKGRGLRARVELFDAAGTKKGARELSSNTSNCTELASALALAITIAIDPLQMSRPSPPAATPTPAAPPPILVILPADDGPPPRRVVVEKLPTPPAPTERRRVVFHAAVMVLGTDGAGPGLGVGFLVQAGLRTGAFSLSVEGRQDLASSTAVGAGSIDGSLSLGGLAPCFHAGWLSLCAVGYAGVLRGSSTGISDPRRDSTFYASAGGRAALEIPLWRNLAARAQVDLLAPITRTTLSVNATPAWTTPPVSGVLGLGIAGNF